MLCRAPTDIVTASGRQCREQFIVGRVVSHRDDGGINPRSGKDALTDTCFADATEPNFDDLLALEDFERLIAEKVSQEHAQFVGLPGTELSRGRAIVPRQ